MKTNEQLAKGCEHDGSYVPITEVYRLMNLAREEEKTRILRIIGSHVPTPKGASVGSARRGLEDV
jgi:hypothetical protein